MFYLLLNNRHCLKACEILTKWGNIVGNRLHTYISFAHQKVLRLSTISKICVLWWHKSLSNRAAYLSSQLISAVQFFFFFFIGPKKKYVGLRSPDPLYFSAADPNLFYRQLFHPNFCLRSYQFLHRIRITIFVV